jgi:UDP:flavonoid glycosyltransferase YjiC (YdhE family)
MAENGIRVQWSGCGRTVPGRLRRRDPLRWAARELLADVRYRRSCEMMAASVRPEAAEERAAVAVERLAERRRP